MDYIMEDILSGEIVPVLLGASPEAGDTAHRMYRQYGVVSHVFCNKVPLSFRLSLCMKFHVIPQTDDQRLMCEALDDFAKQLGHADLILYLIPCTEEFAKMVWDCRDTLETRYVIADREEMERVWFGEEFIQYAKAKEERT